MLFRSLDRGLNVPKSRRANLTLTRVDNERAEIAVAGTFDRTTNLTLAMVNAEISENLVAGPDLKPEVKRVGEGEDNEISMRKRDIKDKRLLMMERMQLQVIENLSS